MKVKKTLDRVAMVLLWRIDDSGRRYPGRHEFDYGALAYHRAVFWLSVVLVVVAVAVNAAR